MCLGRFAPKINFNNISYVWLYRKHAGWKIQNENIQLAFTAHIPVPEIEYNSGGAKGRRGSYGGGAHHCHITFVLKDNFE